MEGTNKNIWIVGVGIACLLLVIGWFILRSHSAPETFPPMSNVNATSTTAPTTTLSQKNSNEGSVSIGYQKNTAPNIVMPNIDRPYTPSADLPVNIQTKSKQEVAFAKQQLHYDPNNKAYWITLAPYFEAAGDYKGAEEIWLYCNARWPEEPICYNNLADLYANYLHDYTKAITYWNKLITVQPTNVLAYINLATLYSTTLHDPEKAKATIAMGLKANPNNANLQNFTVQP